MMVLPLTFRMRCIDRRSKTRRRLSRNQCQNGEGRDRVRDKLECKMRGACVSIDCEPNNVCASSSCRLSIDGFAESCIASYRGIERKKVRVIVMSIAGTSKKKSNHPAPRSDQTHGRRLFPGFLLENVMESSARMRTRKMVQC